MGVYQNIKTGLFPQWAGLLNQADQRSQQQGNSKKDLSRSIAPVQLARVKQDVQTWRGWMNEAENAWYPHRVKQQQGYDDTILNGQVEACMNRRLNLTMLKNYNIVNKTSRKPNPVTTALIKKQWFRNVMKYSLQAKGFGYSLIYLGDCINDAFPNASIIKRFNISPDRLNVTQFIYSISGANFLDPEFAPWHIWVTTPSDIGVSKVGYGYLYKVAFYEIIARNVLTQNLDATERYGMPMLKGKTSKSQESAERAIFETAMAEMGSNGWILMDAVGDEVEIVESKSLGNGYKIYESLETRAEKKISKIILGHADAMDSTPGKLGGDQGGEESPAQAAMRDTATTDMTDFTELCNDQILPKLRQIGLLIPDEEEFEFDNNDELAEARDKEDSANLKTATVYKTIKNAGGDPDWDAFGKKTGIKTAKTAPVIPVAPPVMGADKDQNNPDDKGSGKKDVPLGKGVKKDVKARLEKLYERHTH